MIKSEWKSYKEIKFILGDARKISILSCGACANLIDTGGSIGISILKDITKQMNKEVTFSKCILACCIEEVMRQALKNYNKYITESDVLVILSCSSGLKLAYLCSPKIRTISVLDSVETSPLITQHDDVIIKTVCSLCGHCVINYTGGICPINLCPVKSKYGPCSKSSKESRQCSIKPEIECIWKEIEQKGDFQSLQKLREIHEFEGDAKYLPSRKRHTPTVLRKLVGLLSARLPLTHNIIRMLR